MNVAGTLSPRDYDAVLFDLDGVLTRTASVNAAAWKRIRYRGHSLDLRLTRRSLTIRGGDGAALPITLCVDDEVCEFVSGTTRVFRLNGDATEGGGGHRNVTGDAP